ncbi:MAG: hypothetical protein AAFQ98_05335 [Bacteroidota bacterium]
MSARTFHSPSDILSHFQDLSNGWHEATSENSFNGDREATNLQQRNARMAWLDNVFFSLVQEDRNDDVSMPNTLSQEGLALSAAGKLIQAQLEIFDSIDHSLRLKFAPEDPNTLDLNGLLDEEKNALKQIASQLCPDMNTAEWPKLSEEDRKKLAHEIMDFRFRTAQFFTIQLWRAAETVRTLRPWFALCLQNNEEIRRGTLTDGVLFSMYVKNPDKPYDWADVSPVDVYNSYDIARLTKDQWEGVQTEVQTYLDAITLGKPRTGPLQLRWYYWPGCFFKIPPYVSILFDPGVTHTKLVISQANAKTAEEQARQIIINEQTFSINVTSFLNQEFARLGTNQITPLWPHATERPPSEPTASRIPVEDGTSFDFANSNLTQKNGITQWQEQFNRAFYNLNKVTFDQRSRYRQIDHKTVVIKGDTWKAFQEAMDHINKREDGQTGLINQKLAVERKFFIGQSGELLKVWVELEIQDLDQFRRILKVEAILEKGTSSEEGGSFRIKFWYNSYVKEETFSAPKNLSFTVHYPFMPIQSDIRGTTILTENGNRARTDAIVLSSC